MVPSKTIPHKINLDVKKICPYVLVDTFKKSVDVRYEMYPDMSVQYLCIQNKLFF